MTKASQWMLLGENFQNRLIQVVIQLYNRVLRQQPMNTGWFDHFPTARMLSLPSGKRPPDIVNVVRRLRSVSTRPLIINHPMHPSTPLPLPPHAPPPHHPTHTGPLRGVFRNTNTNTPEKRKAGSKKTIGQIRRRKPPPAANCHLQPTLPSNQTRNVTGIRRRAWPTVRVRLRSTNYDRWL